MKKALTFAIAVIAAATIHAATIAWGSDSTVDAGNTAGYVGDGTTSEDYEGYAAAGTVYNLIFLGADYAGGATAAKYDTNTGLTDLGGTIVDTHTLSPSEAENGSFADSTNGTAADMLGYYIVTMYDPASDFGSATTAFQINDLSDTASGYSIVSRIDSMGLGSASSAVAVIPEPTSVALLALGLAALGLKRKVA